METGDIPLDSCASLTYPAMSGSVWDSAQSIHPKQSFVKGDEANTVYISSHTTVSISLAHHLQIYQHGTCAIRLGFYYSGHA